LSYPRYKRGHIVWQWGGEFHPFSALRVLKAYLFSVQRLPGKGS
jgi:hypothetical protein